jgi:glycosyl transferase, family 25
MNDLKLVINLACRKDRRIEMQRQLARIGWTADFCEAIRPSDRGPFPTIGARGCYLSHMECLKSALAKKATRLILMEDDLNFSTNVPQAWNSVRAFLENSDFDIFYAGHHFDHKRGLSGIVKISASEHCTGAHFLIFSQSGVERFARGLQEILLRPEGHPFGGPMHVDGAYSTIRAQNPSIITYAHFPSLGYQRSSRTDIHNRRFLDRVPLLAPFVRLGRKAKNALRSS